MNRYKFLTEKPLRVVKAEEAAARKIAAAKKKKKPKPKAKAKKVMKKKKPRYEYENRLRQIYYGIG